VPRDSLYTSSAKLIGPIAVGFLYYKVLVINFPGKRTAMLDSAGAYWRARTMFMTARVKNNRFHISLTINHRTYWTLFDTGSSLCLFAFNTDYATWREVVGGAAISDSL
jgi:hypothetical protein